MQYKKRHNEKLTFKDYIMLMKMSMRSWIWKHEGDSFVQNLRKNGATLGWALFWYFIVGFAIGCIGNILRLIITVFLSIFVRVPGVTFGKAIMALIESVVVGAGVELCIFNPKKLLRNIGYSSSAWWYNTGTHPVMLELDPGLYGEYMATMCVEDQIKESGVYGKIYNSLMVPMRNHDIDTFSESDVVAVTENGIHVFEVKNQRGIFAGRFDHDIWFKDEKYDADPPYHSPMKQNQNHVNYIIEYLYPKLVESGLKDPHIQLNDYFKNVVMFTENKYTYINLDFSCVPSNTSFCCSSGQEYPYDINVLSSHDKLTHQQVDYICGLFDKLSDVTAQQHAAMVGEKVYNDSQMEYSDQYRAVYRAVMVRFDEKVGAMVSRYNGNYTWYDIKDENNFWAFPELEITHSVETGAGEEGFNRAKAIVTEWKNAMR